MATQVQFRRGSTSDHSSFTGVVGEVTVDTDKDTAVIHDGATAGGHPVMKEDGSNSAIALGSAASPALKFTGDVNTGIYSPGADAVAVSTGGTERLQVEADGSAKFSGRAYGLERTITASAFDLTEGNFWTCGAIAIPNPTNGVAGQSGLIIVTAAPTSFGSDWDFPGGAYTAPSTFPAVAPFYVRSSTQFYLGNWTEGIA